MRRAHVMAHNKGGEYPRDVVVMDTETRQVQLDADTVGHVLVFGWAMFVRRKRGDVWSEPQWHRFETAAAFWKWACSKVRSRGKLCIYCHNAEFDLQVVDGFGIMERRKWALFSACLEGPPTIVKWRRGDRTIMWLDTLNVWRVPLSALGARLNLPKLEMPEQWTGSDADDIYCRRDVEIVWRALLAWWAFLRENDLGTCAPTLAGQALNAFRHRFMEQEIFIDANEDALALARESYLGGRCDCFTIGLVPDKVTVLDVNSMYPYVMRDLFAPVRLLTVRGITPLADIERYLTQYCLVADVTLDTPEPAFPHVIEGRLCFPVGRFRQSLASPELAYAMQRGYVKTVHRCAIYERAQLFAGFVNWVWSKRKEAQARGDDIADWQCKILGNSLYGKFGQRGRVWQTASYSPFWKVESSDSYSLDTLRWQRVRQIGRLLQTLKEDGESSQSHPAIAAHVTSAARMHLWYLNTRAGLENVHYNDTDSLMVTGDAMQRLHGLLSEDTLGGLGTVIEDATLTIHGPKDYELNGQFTRKGIRDSAIEIAPGVFRQDQWGGWAGAIRRGRLDMPTTATVEKRLSRRYTKGTIGPNGRVSPLVLPLPGDD